MGALDPRGNPALTHHFKILSKQFFVFLLALFCLHFTAFSENGEFQGASSKVDEACSGVVRILGVAEDGRKCWTGSGFGVGSTGQPTNIFVTNRHVVADDSGNLVKDIYILLDNDAARRTETGSLALDHAHMVKCELLYASEGYPDIALLRASKMPEGRVALPMMRSEQSSRSETVYALGYPGSGDLLNGEQYFAASVGDVVATTGAISRFGQFAMAGDTWVVQHDAQIIYGDSGGPLVNAEGAVLGINTYLIGNEGERDFYISIFSNYAMEALDSLGLPYDVYMAGEILQVGESTSPELSGQEGEGTAESGIQSVLEGQDADGREGGLDTAVAEAEADASAGRESAFPEHFLLILALVLLLVLLVIFIVFLVLRARSASRVRRTRDGYGGYGAGYADRRTGGYEDGYGADTYDAFDGYGGDAANSNYDYEDGSYEAAAYRESGYDANGYYEEDAGGGYEEASYPSAPRSLDGFAQRNYPSNGYAPAYTPAAYGSNAPASGYASGSAYASDAYAYAPDAYRSDAYGAASDSPAAYASSGYAMNDGYVPSGRASDLNGAAGVYAFDGYRLAEDSAGYGQRYAEVYAAPEREDYGNSGQFAGSAYGKASRARRGSSRAKKQGYGGVSLSPTNFTEDSALPQESYGLSRRQSRQNANASAFSAGGQSSPGNSRLSSGWQEQGEGGYSAYPSSLTFVLIAKAGVLSGRRYVIPEPGDLRGAGAMTIGRNPESVVCFPRDTPGVSRKHAMLYWEGRQLMLMDRNSLNGTYLEGVGKIPPMEPIELRRGDIIYIGERRNQFQLAMQSYR